MSRKPSAKRLTYSFYSPKLILTTFGNLSYFVLNKTGFYGAKITKIADEIKGVRLQWDVHAALEKLYRAWGKDAQADEQTASVTAIVNQIRGNLNDDALKIGLPVFKGKSG